MQLSDVSVDKRHHHEDHDAQLQQLARRRFTERHADNFVAVLYTLCKLQNARSFIVIVPRP